MHHVDAQLVPRSCITVCDLQQRALFVQFDTILTRGANVDSDKDLFTLVDTTMQHIKAADKATERHLAVAGPSTKPGSAAGHRLLGPNQWSLLCNGSAPHTSGSHTVPISMPSRADAAAPVATGAVARAAGQRSPLQPAQHVLQQEPQRSNGERAVHNHAENGTPQALGAPGPPYLWKYSSPLSGPAQRGMWRADERSKPQAQPAAPPDKVRLDTVTYLSKEVQEQIFTGRIRFARMAAANPIARATAHGMAQPMAQLAAESTAQGAEWRAAQRTGQANAEAQQALAHQQQANDQPQARALVKTETGASSDNATGNRVAAGTHGAAVHGDAAVNGGAADSGVAKERDPQHNFVQHAVKQEAAAELTRGQDAGQSVVLQQRAMESPAAHQPVQQEPVAQQVMQQEHAMQQPIKQEAIPQQVVHQERAVQQPVKQEHIAQQVGQQEHAMQPPIKQEFDNQHVVQQEPAVQQPIKQKFNKQHVVQQEPAVKQPIKQEPGAQQRAAQRPAARRRVEQREFIDLCNTSSDDDEQPQPAVQQQQQPAQQHGTQNAPVNTAPVATGQQEPAAVHNGNIVQVESAGNEVGVVPESQAGNAAHGQQLAGQQLAPQHVAVPPGIYISAKAQVGGPFYSERSSALASCSRGGDMVAVSHSVASSTFASQYCGLRVSHIRSSLVSSSCVARVLHMQSFDAVGNCLQAALLRARHSGPKMALCASRFGSFPGEKVVRVRAGIQKRATPRATQDPATFTRMQLLLVRIFNNNVSDLMDVLVFDPTHPKRVLDTETAMSFPEAVRNAGWPSSHWQSRLALRADRFNMVAMTEFHRIVQPDVYQSSKTSTKRVLAELRNMWGVAPGGEISFDLVAHRAPLCG